MFLKKILAREVSDNAPGTMEVFNTSQIELSSLQLEMEKWKP